MEKKLIPMTDFVLEHPSTTDYEWQLSNHFKYANFLKQPLKKGMFVPCDDDDNVLYKPFECSCSGYVEDCVGCEFTDIKYQQAKEKVLFYGFYISKDYITNGDLQIDDEWIQGKTIEDLIPYNLTLINYL